MASTLRIEIEKFNGQNFELWKLKMEDLLVNDVLWSLFCLKESVCFASLHRFKTYRVRCLCNVWTIWIYYKLRVFEWLVIYHGLPSKSRIDKIGLFDGLWVVCQCQGTVRFFGNVNLLRIVGARLRINSQRFFRAGFIGGKHCLVMANILFVLRIMGFWIVWG